MRRSVSLSFLLGLTTAVSLLTGCMAHAPSTLTRLGSVEAALPAAPATEPERAPAPSPTATALALVGLDPPATGVSDSYADPERASVHHGVASYYASRFHGRTTASGEPYDEQALTAAHRTLPLGTRIRVTNLLNDRGVELTVNDRGPYVGQRVIDLSLAAARRLGFVRRGLAPVRIDVLSPARRPTTVDAATARNEGSGIEGETLRR